MLRVVNKNRQTTGEIFSLSNKKVFFSLQKFRSKPLNVHSEPLNGHSKPLNRDLSARE